MKKFLPSRVVRIIEAGLVYFFSLSIVPLRLYIIKDVGALVQTVLMVTAWVTPLQWVSTCIFFLFCKKRSIISNFGRKIGKHTKAMRFFTKAPGATTG